MSYVDRVLLPGEHVTARANIHWVIYLTGLLVLGVAAIVYIAALAEPLFAPAMNIVALVMVLFASILIVSAWVYKYGTEIAVTNHRAIYKSGIISRRTVEMNLDQIEIRRGAPVHSRSRAGLWRYRRARHRRRHREYQHGFRSADGAERYYGAVVRKAGAEPHRREPKRL